APPIGIASSTAPGGSEIYVIAPDGAPQRLWSSHEDLVYALVFEPTGRLLIGTGNRGRVYAIDKGARPGTYTDLLKASANQVTSFAFRRDGGLYAAASNLGKL